MTAATAVLAGGLGTRVASVTGPDQPKALLDVGGAPFIDRKLAELARNGVHDVLVLTGHRGGALETHLESRSVEGELRVRWRSDGDQLLGTGGAVAAAIDDLPELFWVTYGDTLLEVEMAPIETTLTTSDADGLLVVVKNDDQIQRSNTTLHGELVRTYSKGAPPGTHDHLDYGLVLLRRRAFDEFGGGRRFDLGELFQALAARGRLRGHAVGAEFHDIGTPEAWIETSRRYSST